MKQIARIAKTRCYVLAELLYIRSSALRQRPVVIFCQRFCMSSYLSESSNNEIFLITHLSADNLSGLNFLSVSHLCFFCHRILRSHALKIKISKKSSWSRYKRLQIFATWIASCRHTVDASCL